MVESHGLPDAAREAIAAAIWGLQTEAERGHERLDQVDLEEIEMWCTVADAAIDALVPLLAEHWATRIEAVEAECTRDQDYGAGLNAAADLVRGLGSDDA